jgi:hypothetical protein
MMIKPLLILLLASGLSACNDTDEPLKNGADSPTVYRAPSYVLTGNQLDVTDAGIRDEDGVVGRVYTLTNLESKQTITNQTGQFRTLPAGRYHLQIQASAWDGNLHLYVLVYNSNPDEIRVV